MEKFVLISGAAGGIGLAAVRALAGAGFKVFAGALDEREVALLNAESLQEVIPVILDVSKTASIDAALHTIEERMSGKGQLVGVINNAGVNYNAPLQYLSVAEVRQMVEVNLLGSILLTRAVLPLLRMARHARVVFTGSATGFLASPMVSSYAATKSGIEGLANGLRVEFKPLGIRVSVIEPGVVRTPMTAAAPRILDAMLGRMPAADRALYEQAMRKIAHLSSAPGAGIPPERVAAAIIHALTAARSRARYPVGVDSKAASLLHHLPAAVTDFIQRKIFSLSGV